MGHRLFPRAKDCADFVAEESWQHFNCSFGFNQNKASEKISESKNGQKPS